MTIGRAGRVIVVLSAVALLAGCGGGFGNWFGGSGDGQRGQEILRQDVREERLRETGQTGSILDLFIARDDPSTTVVVNRYLWNASLQVLDFLPVESVDPFSGVIVTGFGTPPGGGRPYRATVHVSDGALDARGLNVALMTTAGPASPETVRAVENAILTRARQMRIQDRRF